jgi:hypothetical protein
MEMPLCSGISRINILKMAILLKAINRFDAISIKIPILFLHRNRKINPKIHLEAQKTLSSYNNPE